MWYDSQIALNVVWLVQQEGWGSPIAQIPVPPARYLDMYYMISIWYWLYRRQVICRYYIIYVPKLGCSLVSAIKIFFLFLCWGWVVGYRWVSIILYVQDTRISDEVYRISIRVCDIIYLNLFVGWWCLQAWYISSLRMRVRMVTTDRIIRIM